MFILCQEAEPTPCLVGCNSDSGKKNQPRWRVEEGGSEGYLGKHVPERGQLCSSEL